MKKRLVKQSICTAQGEELLSVKDAATLFNIPYQELVTMVRDGKIEPWTYSGHMVFVKLEDVKALRF